MDKGGILQRLAPQYYLDLLLLKEDVLCLQHKEICLSSELTAVEEEKSIMLIMMGIELNLNKKQYKTVQQSRIVCWVKCY